MFLKWAFFSINLPFPGLCPGGELLNGQSVDNQLKSDAKRCIIYLSAVSDNLKEKPEWWKEEESFPTEGNRMPGNFGFSYMGLLFLLMLFIPNIIWAKGKPQGFTSENENKILLFLERAGEVLTCCCLLVFSDFNIHGWSLWSLWLMAAFVFIILYEAWWVRYFRSERKRTDFYSGFLGIPLAGATLPVMAFFMLGIYGKVVWMLIAALIFGIGHIGIHMRHKKSIDMGN